MSINQRDHLPHTNDKRNQSETESEQPRIYPEVEKPNSYRVAKQVGGIVLGVTTLVSIGTFAGVELAGHNAKADSPQNHTVTAPAVPGKSTELAPQTAAVNPNEQKVVIRQADGTEVTYANIHAYITANQVLDPQGIPDQSSIDHLLANVNTIGHMVPSSPSETLNNRTGDLARGTLEDAAAKTVLSITPDPNGVGGYTVLNPSVATQLGPAGLENLVDNDFTKGQIHTFKVVGDRITPIGPIAATTEMTAPVVLEDSTIDAKTGEVLSTVTESEVIHFNSVNGVDGITEVDKQQ